MTAQLDPEAKTETAELTTGTNREKAVCHGSDAMLAKKTKNWRDAKRRSPARNQNPNE